MTDLLDDATYTALRRPLLDASGLPPGCYHDPAFYQRELGALFARGWHIIGRLDQIAAPGDYLTAAIGQVGLVAVRGDDGAARVFANACRHRGTPLVSGSGKLRAFICPYHSWTYAIDGTLRGAGGMEDTHDFRLADFPLRPVRSGEWGGFLLASLDADGPSLTDWLGNLSDRLAHYQFADMVATRVSRYTVACNWKLWVENFMEGYHIATVHRSTISRQKVVNTPEDPGPGQYVSIYERHEGTRALLQGDTGFPPIETLAGDSAAGSRFVLIYPSSMLAIAVDAMWSLVCNPTGPESCEITVTYCFPKSRTERADFEEIARNYYKRVDITLPEDNVICELQQVGLRSPMAEAGRFSAKEKIVHALDNWIVEKVIGK
jgi:phenylpropionate dioxygenase-like ring-hydroxylating dioxygenase large terminal subunit